MDSIEFVKMQGIGNDFVLVDGRAIQGIGWSGLARRVCDRRFGIGADGLLVIDNSHEADFMMRMYNPDGTPDVCGNGLRCVARYAVERLAFGDRSEAIGVRRSDGGDQRPTPNAQRMLNIATFAGVHPTWATPWVSDVTVDMGAPRFEPEAIPALIPGQRIVDYTLEVNGETLITTALSTGTAHVVIFVDELPDDMRFMHLSPRIENHPLFPERTSVMWCRVDSPSLLRLRIWERGAGETLGCGTGACAAAVAAAIHGFTNEPVTVASKGGELTIDWREEGTILMTGPAEYVFEGQYPL